LQDIERVLEPLPTNRAARPSLHLAYLDGLRAVAALYVLVFHVMMGFSLGSLTGSWRFLRRAFAYGHEAVAIFIVLSGYCLMLPVVRKSSTRLEAPFAYFMRRRALRILPPYFAALAVSLTLLATVAPLRVARGETIWDDSLPGLELGAIVSHVLLVHNWFSAWKVQINGPLWSVATEWQIYFFFPLLLLPAWRRFGMGGALLAAAVFAYVPSLVVPAAADAAVWWYLLLFAFGMAAATIGFSQAPSEAKLRARLPWGIVSGACWLLCAGFSLGAATLWFGQKPLTDPLVGLAAATLLVHLTARTIGSSRPRGFLLAALEAPPLVGLGHFSYSLYLTHLPIIALCKLALTPLTMPPLVAAFVLLLVGGSASVAFAYAFFLVVERPFLVRR
jgi:peptidoglycan/LPS O-acetylase OafA/YrhL